MLWLPVQQYQEDGHIVWEAVGAVLGHLPGNIVHPIIFASEATQHVLSEVKKQREKLLRNGRPINNVDIVVLIYAKI